MSSIVQTVQDENIEVNFKDATAVFSSLIILRLAVAAAQRCRSQSALYNQRHENPINISAEPVFFSKKKSGHFPKVIFKKRSLSFICLKTRSGMKEEMKRRTSGRRLSGRETKIRKERKKNKRGRRQEHTVGQKSI